MNDFDNDFDLQKNLVLEICIANWISCDKYNCISTEELSIIWDFCFV